MAEKEYRCHRWPSLSLGSGAQIKFVDGVYKTADESEQALIEGLDYYGPLVWHEPEEQKAVVEETEPVASFDTPSRQKWKVK